MTAALEKERHISLKLPQDSPKIFRLFAWAIILEDILKPFHSQTVYAYMQDKTAYLTAHLNAAQQHRTQNERDHKMTHWVEDILDVYFHKVTPPEGADRQMGPWL